MVQERQQAGTWSSRYTTDTRPGMVEQQYKYTYLCKSSSKCTPEQTCLLKTITQGDISIIKTLDNELQ